MILLRDKLSEIYEGKINKDILDIPLPQEKFANCSNCFHCSHVKSPTYNSKCCTYHPQIPNYVVGAILADESIGISEGKKRIKNIITNRIGVTPYGIVPPPGYTVAMRKYTQIKKKSREDAEAMSCPLISTGSCTIWNYRPELCATYHCASVSGQKGGQFWNIYLKYLTYVERIVSRYVMLELNYPIAQLQIKIIKPEKLDLYDEKGQIDPGLYSKLWGEFENKEVEFYRQSYDVFNKIDVKQLSALMGFNGDVYQDKLLVQAKKSRDSILPDLLLFDEENNEVIHQKNNMVIINGLKVGPVKYRLLKTFDGKTPTNTIIRRSLILKTSLLKIVEKLIDNGTLTEYVKSTN